MRRLGWHAGTHPRHHRHLSRADRVIRDRVFAGELQRSSAGTGGGVDAFVWRACTAATEGLKFFPDDVMSRFPDHDRPFFAAGLQSGWILTFRDGGTIYEAGGDCAIWPLRGKLRIAKRDGVPSERRSVNLNGAERCGS